MYERTISFFTFSKSYAMTGLRLGYVAARDPALRERMKKALFYTASNVSSVVQYGGIGALEGSQDNIAQFRRELQARRDLFYAGVREHAGSVFSGAPPRGAFYAFLRINPSWRAGAVEPIDLVGDGGAPDFEGPDRMRPGRRTSAPTARVTSGSASPAIAASSQARSSRWNGCSRRPRHKGA